MKILFYISIGLILICLLALAYAYKTFSAKGWKDTDIAEVRIGDAVFRAEVAATPLKKSAGLSARPELAPNTGMLFVFSSPHRYPFWMRGMRIPLDFIWIRNGVVVDVSRNIPPPENQLVPSTVTPSEPADMVLEVNAGETENIQAGQHVQIKRILQ
jgi:uncharacterized membrane protein (UPF0127 family)